MSAYDLVYLGKLGEGLVRIATDNDVRMWSRSPLRKPQRCAVCDATMPMRTLAYRPFGNMLYRSLRIHAEHVDREAPRL